MDLKEYLKKMREYVKKRYGGGLKGYYNSSPDLEGKFLHWVSSNIKRLFK
jgi:ABC-type transporter MlaC component